MKYSPRLPDENVNVSRTHPLAELGWLAGGLVLICGLVFALLGLAADWAALKTPAKIETWLGQQALQQYPSDSNKALQKRLDGLLNRLPADSPLRQYQFRVFLADSDQVNAAALPGGNIVVFKGLLKQVQSENELAMILAHELGHFAHRDHLRGLGRGLGLTVATALLFGENNSASKLVANTLVTFQLRYSRQQETAADHFALDLLQSRYGHVGGSSDFFRRIAGNSGSKIPYLLASHPHPQARIAYLQKLIKENGYRTGPTTPLAEELVKLAGIQKKRQGGS